MSRSDEPGPLALTVTTARVYGSQSRYGPSPRESPISGPLVLHDFPQAGYEAQVHLGPPVEWLFRADTLSLAIGAAVLRGIGGPAGGRGSPEDRVAQFERDPAFSRDTDEHEWYVTIAISHQVAVAPDLVREEKYVWLDAGEALRLERAERPGITEAMDAIAASLATVLREECFESVVLGDRTHFALAGRETFRLPQIQMGSLSLVFRGGELDTDAVARALEASRGVARELASVAF